MLFKGKRLINPPSGPMAEKIYKHICHIKELKENGIELDKQPLKAKNIKLKEI